MNTSPMPPSTPICPCGRCGVTCVGFNDVTQLRIENRQWLSRTPTWEWVYECGTVVRITMPIVFNEGHPLFRFWGALPLNHGRPIASAPVMTVEASLR